MYKQTYLKPDTFIVKVEAQAMLAAVSGSTTYDEITTGSNSVTIGGYDYGEKELKGSWGKSTSTNDFGDDFWAN